VTWESLAFQPYFTATASNIGYGWWSHDIGGHMWGYKDDDLATRWVQLGVFSPVNRLHSSSMPFTGKEPWRFRPDAQAAMTEFLRLRHRLVPYLHTMNHRASAEGRPIVEPMYYEYPEADEAYEVPNQYLFGSELMVAPIVSPRTRALNRASVEAWLPPGQWIDFFTGTRYEGGRRARLYRTLDTIPVLARAGAIVPLAHPDELGNGVAAPQCIELRVFVGASGEFTLIEDDGSAAAGERGHQVRTRIEFDGGTGRLRVHPAEGAVDGVPRVRSWEVAFVGAADDEGSAPLRMRVDNVDASEGFTLTPERGLRPAPNRTVADVERLLEDVHEKFTVKGEIFARVASGESPARIVAALAGMGLEPDLFGALVELILADAG
jgi:alpha-glucosidase (family GH31 glycosyl hydrolase)